MQHLQLNRQQRLDLKAALKRARRAGGCPREGVRLNVILCLADGQTIADIVKFLHLDEDTVRTYRNKYLEGGLKPLLKMHYKGSDSFLDDLEKTSLQEELRSNIHRTTDSIIQWVLKKFDVEYSRSGMTKLLHAVGFSYKKPKKTSYKTPIPEQRTYLEDVLQPCLKAANTEHYFLDASHPTLMTQTDYGWFERGKESMIPFQGARRRLNLLGSVGLHGNRVFMDYPGQVDKEAVVKHIQRVVSQVEATKKVVIILDNASCHKGAAKDPRLREIERLTLLFLPVASPALNLAERLWLKLKKEVVHNKFIDNVHDLKCSIKKKLCRWRAFPHEIADLFAPRFHLFDKANAY